MPLEILARRQRAGKHFVNVERSVQVIDFVLKNARVPTVSPDADGLGMLIEAFDSDRERTWNNGR